jgi:hypothetical protein
LYQPANIQAVDYDGASHPKRFGLYHPDYGPSTAAETRAWLWDGNDRLLTCQLINAQCTTPVFSLDGLGDYNIAAGTISVNDRNRAGIVVTSHSALAFQDWTDSMGSAFARYGAWTNDVCSSDAAYCTIARDGKLTADGWTLDNDTWQGARTYDGTVGQWNSPDAYAGDVHDPMSQKPFMWNRNNPYAYSDPSGFNPIRDAATSAANFLILDDLRTAKDPKMPGWARALAVASILSNLAGPEVKGGEFALKGIIKISEAQLQHVAERHFVENGAKASGKFASGATQADIKGMVDHAIKGAGANNISASQENIKILTDFGRTIGTSNGKDTSLMASFYDLQGNFLSAYPVKK